MAPEAASITLTVDDRKELLHDLGLILDSLGLSTEQAAGVKYLLVRTVMNRWELIRLQAEANPLLEVEADDGWATS